MSLLDDFARTCVIMEKKRIGDGAGGFITGWIEGEEFGNYMTLDTSMEARIAEKQGVTSLYSALVRSDFPIEYNDYFKDKTTGFTYRVTSNPDEKVAPKSSSFALKYFTAERKELTE